MKITRTAIKELRRIHGMTQQELADAVGAAKGTISLIEQGKRNISLEMAFRLCELFHITLNNLFYIRSAEDIAKAVSFDEGGPEMEVDDENSD